MDEQEKFERSINFSLKWEGGRNFYIVDGKPVVKGAAKNDWGWATAYGIIISTLKAAHKAGIVEHDDICKLNQDEAKKFTAKISGINTNGASLNGRSVFAVLIAVLITAVLQVFCRGQSLIAVKVS